MDESKISTVLERMEEHVCDISNPFVERATREATPFTTLIACLLSLRTRDEVTAERAEALFELAWTAEELVRLNVKTIEKTIKPVGFYRRKARTVKNVARTIIEEYGGEVPDTVEELVKIKGVGRKTANLVVAVAYNKPAICVDTHVHRVMNRLGYVRTKEPDKTEAVLREKLPEEHWIGINRLLIRFGRNVCTPISPHCSTCPVLEYCDQAGVEKHR